MELNIRTEQYIEPMALSAIAVETMLDDSVLCVVYSNEGSSQSVVQAMWFNLLLSKEFKEAFPLFLFLQRLETL